MGIMKSHQFLTAESGFFKKKLIMIIIIIIKTFKDYKDNFSWKLKKKKKPTTTL